MAVYKASNVTVTYNGEDMTKHFDPAELEWFGLRLDSTPQPMDVDPDWFVQQPAEWSGSIEFPLTFVRVRPAAPVRSCLWRRNLDGSAWRKRGHAAHRS